MKTASEMMQYVRALPADSSLYVLNTSNAKSEDGRYSKLALHVRQDGETINVVVPATSAPFDLTSKDATLASLRASGSFRDLLAKGYMKVLSEDEALTMLGDPNVQAEIARVNNLDGLRGSIGRDNPDMISTTEVNTPLQDGAPAPAIPLAAPGGRPDNPYAARPAAPATAAKAGDSTATLVGSSDADDILLPFVTRFLSGKMDLAAVTTALKSAANHATVNDIAQTLAAVVGKGTREDQVRDVLLDLLTAKRKPAAAAPAIKKPVAGLKLPVRK